MGTLVDDDGAEAIGYWYHPRSQQYHVIAWNAANGVDTYTDHCDVVFEHPDWFGMENWEGPDGLELYDLECDGVRYETVLKGWVRIGYNKSVGLWMEAPNPRAAQAAVRWFVSHHGMPQGATIDIATREAQTGYNVRGEDLVAFEQTGRLMPHTKGKTYSWNA